MTRSVSGWKYGGKSKREKGRVAAGRYRESLRGATVGVVRIREGVGSHPDAIANQSPASDTRRNVGAERFALGRGVPDSYPDAIANQGSFAETLVLRDSQIAKVSVHTRTLSRIKHPLSNAIQATPRWGEV